MSSGLKVLILCGVVGSGKTFFSTALCENRPYWHRISQGDLGSRRVCEAASTAALNKGLNVVIDRCNFDTSQRRTWVNIAKRNGGEVFALELKTPVERCRQRILRRENHPTGVIGPFGSGILDQITRSYRSPQALEEGIQKVYSLNMSEDVAWSPAMLERVLQRLGIEPTGSTVS